MAKVIITKETRERLLSAASSGKRIAALDFILTRGDRDFQTELVATAKRVKNQLFFDSLDRFLIDQERKYAEQLNSRTKVIVPPKPQSSVFLKYSFNYKPTGMGFREFLETQGYIYYPQQYVRFVSGGAFESNRRRH